MRRTTSIFCCLILISLAAIAQTPPAPHLDAWMSAWNRGQGFEALYDPGATLILEDGSVVSGREAVIEHYNGLKKQWRDLNSVALSYEFEAENDIWYQVCTLATASGKNLKQLIVGRREGGQFIREVEIYAEIGPPKLQVNEIDRARRRWSQLCNQHNAKRLVSNLYQANAVYYNHKPVVIGTDSIAKTYQYMNRADYYLQLNPLIIDPVHKDLLYEVGLATGSYNGKYVLVWKRQPDGSWKILFDSNV